MKNQRRQFKLYSTGGADTSFLSQDRIKKLKDLGFDFAPTSRMNNQEEDIIEDDKMEGMDLEYDEGDAMEDDTIE